jgi:hypothetical protein
MSPKQTAFDLSDELQGAPKPEPPRPGRQRSARRSSGPTSAPGGSVSSHTSSAVTLNHGGRGFWRAILAVDPIAHPRFILKLIHHRFAQECLAQQGRPLCP